MTKISEAERLQALTQIEKEYWARGVFPAGMDEVGRGPLAGPVVTACVILPPEPLIEHVNDSKKVSEGRREKLHPILKKQAIALGLGRVEAEVIDGINILNATKLAFKQAYENMNHDCPIVLVDAVGGLDIPGEQRAIIHGDAMSYLIGAASIIAKVERDRLMREYAKLYPQYGFERNKGYGTGEHIRALKEFGPCPLHRRSFIKNILG